MSPLLVALLATSFFASKAMAEDAGASLSPHGATIAPAAPADTEGKTPEDDKHKPDQDKDAAVASDPGGEVVDGVYVDRLIAPGSLKTFAEEDEEEVETSGLPRSLRVEGILSQNKRGDDTYNEQGLLIDGFWDTRDHGQISVDANLLRSDRARGGGVFDVETQGDYRIGGSGAVWQRNYHVSDHWTMNNGAGVLNTPATPLMRNQYRFFLPTAPYLGVSSELVGANGVLLQGSYGRNGSFEGVRVVGFDVQPGEVMSLGGQWQMGRDWNASASYLSTQGILRVDEEGQLEFQRGNTQGLYAGARRERKDGWMQFNALQSAGDFGPATGFWVDGQANRGRYTHNYGAFYLDPGLAWGAYPINSDAEGAYYRLGYLYGRMSFNASSDIIRSPSGNGFSGEYLTSFMRYQKTASLGIGGGITARLGNGGNSYSTQTFVDKRTRFGQSRAQLDIVKSHSGNDSWQVGFDQSFPTREGSNLAASLTYGQVSYDEQPSSRTASIALYGGRSLTDTISIDGNVRYTHGAGTDALRGVDMNLGVSWRMSNHLTMTGTLYRSQGSQRSPFDLDPLANPGGFVSLPRDQSVFLSLRYERSAGRPLMVLGGNPDGANGDIAGSVYLDDNQDGRRGADEVAAPNLTVLLDGKYATQTDSLGQYRFDRVAIGAHSITIVPDNLPLPWMVDDKQTTQTILVSTRHTATLDVGARKPR